MEKLKLKDVEKVIKGIVKVISETHEIKQVKKSYNYRGVELEHDKILVTNFNIKKSLTKEYLEWEREEHGRTMLEIIILKTFQLGYEQAQIEFDNNEEEYRRNIKMEIINKIL